jgi:flagellar basal-body rod modification protein FlgD
MTVNSVSNDVQYVSPLSSGPNKTLGKDEFLNLLVTQLQHQDPLNPMDSTAFTSQLAEFSALEQLHNVNTNLGTLQTTQAGIENSQAVNYIGKQIMASGATVQMAGGEAGNIHFTLGSDAASVYINVYNAAGQYIKGFEGGSHPAGNHTVPWDGTDNNGNLMSDGIYSFEVLAVDRANQMIPVGTYTTGQVRGVTFQNGEAYLLTDSQEVPLSSVLQIMDGGQS